MKITWCMVLAVASILLLLLLIRQAFPYTQAIFQNNEVPNFSKGWLLNADGGSSGTLVDLPFHNKETQPEEVTRIEKQLPERVFEKPFLRVGSACQSFRVYLDESQIYEFDSMRAVNHGKTGGVTWQMVPLPRDCFGKLVEIEYESSYARTSGVVSSVDFGQKPMLALGVFKAHFLDLIVSVILLFVSVFVGLITLILWKKCGIRCCGYGLSLALFCAGLWIFAESQGFLFFYNNYVLSYYIQFAALFSLPVFLYAYLAKELPSAYERQFLWLSHFHLILLVLLLLGQVTGVCNFFEASLPFSVLFAVSSVFSAGFFLTEMKKNKEQKHLLAIFLMLFMLSLSIVIDNIAYRGMLDQSCIDFFFIGSLLAEIVGGLGICYRITRLMKEKFESQHLKMQLDNQISHYSALEQRDASIRSYRHDMKNHWRVMEHLVATGENDMARTYAQAMLETLGGEKKKVINTGNPILDAILSEKLQQFHEKGIRVSTEIFIVKNIQLEYLDWCSIFGNILDNALDALSMVNGDKWIGIKMVSKSNMLICKFVNSRDGTAPLDKQFMTTKADKESHGFGLKNIRSAIEKYNGSLDIQYDKEIFSVSFILFDVF